VDAPGTASRSGATSIALTKMDVLSIGEIPVCVGYRCARTTGLPYTPVLNDGGKAFTRSCPSGRQTSPRSQVLGPPQGRAGLRALPGRKLGCPIAFVSVGPSATRSFCADGAPGRNPHGTKPARNPPRIATPARVLYSFSPATSLSPGSGLGGAGEPSSAGPPITDAQIQSLKTTWRNDYAAPRL
jgi:hypothetical protein